LIISTIFYRIQNCPQETKFPARMRQVCFANWLTEIDGILIPINGSQEPFL